jgi:hypothetical protein
MALPAERLSDSQTFRASSLLTSADILLATVMGMRMDFSGVFAVKSTIGPPTRLMNGLRAVSSRTCCTR